jgi:glutamate 5-kinase
VAASPGVGTVIQPRAQRLASRKLWIAFAVGSSGTVVVDEGAKRALLDRNVSLLLAGVVGVKGSFDAESAVEVVDTGGAVFAKGLVRYSSDQLSQLAGRRTSALPEGLSAEVIHRDDLVLFAE